MLPKSYQTAQFIFWHLANWGRFSRIAFFEESLRANSRITLYFAFVRFVAFRLRHAQRNRLSPYADACTHARALHHSHTQQNGNIKHRVHKTTRDSIYDNAAAAAVALGNGNGEGKV